MTSGFFFSLMPSNQSYLLQLAIPLSLSCPVNSGRILSPTPEILEQWFSTLAAHMKVTFENDDTWGLQ